MSAIPDDMFTPDVIADPYTYYGRIRDEDPVHWNELYGLWVITRHDDLVWLTRHHELFSSAVFKNDPRPAYPAIDESDLGLYEYVRDYQGDQFIQNGGRDVDHVMELAADLAPGPDALWPVDDGGIASATEMRCHLLGPLKRSVHGMCPRRWEVIEVLGATEFVDRFDVVLPLFRKPVKKHVFAK